MSAAMKQTPQSYTLLHAQCDFLRSKGKLDWAVKLARQAVNCAPSEFVTWEKLTELYIDLGQFESVGEPSFVLVHALTICLGFVDSQFMSNVYIQRSRCPPQFAHCSTSPTIPKTDR